MDLAKKTRPSFSINKRTLNFLIYLPGLWLIFHLLNLSINNFSHWSGVVVWKETRETNIVMSEYLKYRNYFYFLYATLMICAGIYLILKRDENGKLALSNKDNVKNSVTVIIPAVIQGLLLVTFSYAISMFFFNIYLSLSNSI